MARLVVALIALAIMSAGSMYWASAQQISDSDSATSNISIKASAFGALNLAPGATEPTAQPVDGCPGCGGCDSASGACQKDKAPDAAPTTPPCIKRSGCCRGK